MNNTPTLKLTVKDFISVNHYLAYRTVTKNGRAMAMSYKTAEAKKFQKDFIEYVKKQATEQGWITDPDPMQHYYAKQKIESEQLAQTRTDTDATEPIKSDNVISSEVSEMTSLQEAVASVTAAVNEKTNAFNQEASAVASAVESEVTNLEILKDAVDNVYIRFYCSNSF